MSPIIYICPISMSPPRVPVLTNEGTTYDFVSIAQCLLRGTINPQLDPLTRGVINTLIYNRSIKQLNDGIGEVVAPLSDEEKLEIASLYTQLCGRYPTLKICGISTLEGMQILIEERQQHFVEQGKQLYLAAQRGSDDDVRELLANRNVNPNHTMPDGSTPLHIAVQNSHPDIFDILLADERVNPDQVISDGETLLSIAAREGWIEYIPTLLAHERVNPNQVINDGEPLLYYATRQCWVDIVDVLLADERVNPNQVVRDGETLLYAAVRDGWPEIDDIVYVLLEDRRINPNRVVYDGQTLLCIAAQKGWLNAVEGLLAFERVNPNQANNWGATPLNVAAKYGQIEVFKALLAFEPVNPNQADNWGVTPLNVAAEYGHIEVVEALLADKRVDPNQASDGGVTPLYKAAQNGHAAVVKAMLADKRVIINQAMTDGATPLFTAILFGHLEVAQALLSHPDSTYKALSTVAQQGYSVLVSSLLSNPSTLDYYLNQIIQKPELMRDVLKENRIFFDALSIHRDALWSRLQEPDYFNLQPEVHRKLLCSILDSHTERSEELRHPLYMLFYTPKRQRSSIFTNCVANSTLDDIQAYVDNHVYSQSIVHQLT